MADGADECALTRHIDVNQSILCTADAHIEYARDGERDNRACMAIEPVQWLYPAAPAATTAAAAGHYLPRSGLWVPIAFAVLPAPLTNDYAEASAFS